MSSLIVGLAWRLLALPKSLPIMPRRAAKTVKAVPAAIDDSDSFNPAREQDDELLVLQSIHMEEYEEAAPVDGDRVVKLRLLPHPNRLPGEEKCAFAGTSTHFFFSRSSCAHNLFALAAATSRCTWWRGWRRRTRSCRRS